MTKLIYVCQAHTGIYEGFKKYTRITVSSQSPKIKEGQSIPSGILTSLWVSSKFYNTNFDTTQMNMQWKRIVKLVSQANSYDWTPQELFSSIND